MRRWSIRSSLLTIGAGIAMLAVVALAITLYSMFGGRAPSGRGEGLLVICLFGGPILILVGLFQFVRALIGRRRDRHRAESD